MDSSGRHRDLILKCQSRYLRNERRYDRWGALGKLLLVQEVLIDERESGIASPMPEGNDLQEFVNSAFPRTFGTGRLAACSLPATAVRVIQEYRDLRNGLHEEQLDDGTACRLAMEEMAERFALEPSVIVEYLKGSA